MLGPRHIRIIRPFPQGSSACMGFFWSFQPKIVGVATENGPQKRLKAIGNQELPFPQPSIAATE